MQQDLAIAKSLGDTAGECRAHGNLGSAYFSKGSYKEALTAHRYQLVLAMKCKVSGIFWSLLRFMAQTFQTGHAGSRGSAHVLRPRLHRDRRLPKRACVTQTVRPIGQTDGR